MVFSMMDVGSSDDGDLFFTCETTGFGFCIRRFPYEEPVQCWDSGSGHWWFERTFLQARPR